MDPPRGRFVLFADQFLADVFQDVGGTLDATSPTNRIFVFDAQDPFVPDVHVCLQHGLPEGRAVPVADRSESAEAFTRSSLSKAKFSTPYFARFSGNRTGILHVRVENCALFFRGSESLPPDRSPARKGGLIVVRADLFADRFAQFQKRARIVDDEIGCISNARRFTPCERANFAASFQ